jgi:hypothetical protein
MTETPTDSEIDQRLKAGLSEIGLSASDFAGLLETALQTVPDPGEAAASLSSARLAQLAHVLGMAAQMERTGRDPSSEHSMDRATSLETLWQLRLLRAFGALPDDRAQRFLIGLAEQLARRQSVQAGGG